MIQPRGRIATANDGHLQYAEYIMMSSIQGPSIRSTYQHWNFLTTGNGIWHAAEIALSMRPMFSTIIVSLQDNYKR